MVDAAGVPNGMKRVLEERGINTATTDDMQTIMANHINFNEKKHLLLNVCSWI